jgi:uncharacterized protein involved in outer membrane biogenesis
MSELRKRNYKIGFVILALIVCGGAYLLLSQTTFYADIVAQKVRDAFVGSGYTLTISSLEGNPITGVKGRGVIISHDGVIIASADEIEIMPLLSSVLSSNPKLALLSFKKLEASYEVLSTHLPAKSEKESAPPALENAALYESIVTTPWGRIEIDRLRLSLGDAQYEITYSGHYRESEASLNASIDNSAYGMSLSYLTAKWNGMSLAAEGSLTPKTSLAIKAGKIDVRKLAEIVPAINDSMLDGIFDANVRLIFSEGLYVSGDLASKSGVIDRTAYESLKTGFEFSGNVLSLRDFESRLYGAPLKGDAIIDMSKGTKPELSLRFTAASILPETMAGEFPWLEGISGVIDIASCDIRGPSDSLSGPITFSATHLEAMDFDFEDLSVMLGLKKSSGIGVSLSCRSLGSVISASGDVTFDPDTNLDLGVYASPLNLEVLSDRFPEMEKAGLVGEGTAFVRVKGPVSKVGASGSVSFPSLVLSGDIRVEKVYAEFDYSDAGVQIKKAEALWDGASLTAAGLQKGAGGMDFRGGVSGLKLASLSGFTPILQEFGVNGVISGDWLIAGNTSDPVASFDFKIPSLQFKGESISDVAVSAKYHASSLDISSASFKYGRARLSASGSVKLPDGKTPQYNIKGTFGGVDASLLRERGVISEDISGEISGDVRAWNDSSGSGVRVFFRNSDLSFRNLHFAEISGSAALISRDLSFERFRSKMNIGDLSLSGRIGNIPLLSSTSSEGFNLEDLPIDIKISASSADIGRISRIFMPNAHGYQGFVSGSIDVTGTVGAPQFNANAFVYGVRAFGLFLPVIRMEKITGSMNSIHIPDLRALAGRGLISADLELSKSGDIWGGDVSASGRSVDIRSLMAPIDYERKIDASGALDFDFYGKGSAGEFDGTGMARVPKLSLMGANFTELEIPFWITEGYVVVEDSSAKAYGGEVKAQIAKDLRQSDWGGRFEVLSADLEVALKDIMPDSDGVVRGSADLQIFLGGDTRRTSMQSGEGNINIRNGEVLGFQGAEAVSKLLGGHPLRFKALNASFTVDGKTLYLLPGSRVSAPKGDSVFNYIMADGSLTIDKDINLFCVGNVNIRALNSFIGGVRGLVSSAMEEGSSGLTLGNFMGGAITGFTRDEFRDVSLSVRGTSEDIVIEKIVIAEPQKKDLSPVLNEAEQRREKNDETIRLNLEFPVGPGADVRKRGVGNQIGGQVLQRALDGLLTF